MSLIQWSNQTTTLQKMNFSDLAKGASVEASLNLSYSQVQEILVDSLKNVMPGFEISGIVFKIGNQYDRYDNHIGPCLNGIEVKFKAASASEGV